MSFANLNLNPQIFKAIDACGYKEPTPIQASSIPDILEGNDLVASAQTGTGKTAAFVLPALHRLTLSKASAKPRILILTPTRELAAQITQAAHQYGKFLKFTIISLVGGMPYRQQLRDLSRPVDIIVATPGRLLDHMDNRRLDLSGIEMLILDEADRMLDMGFIDDVRDIAKATPATRQTLLFSATVDNKLSGVVRSLLKDPVRIDLSEQMLAPKKITQKLYWTDNAQHKMRLLQHFLANENVYKGIIFSATKINADVLAKKLRDEGFKAAALHGDLKQSMRTKTVEQLRAGKIQFLVATDVAARGIDISDVTHVINYDLPKFSEDYVHRIGRTGRAGKTGIAISFALPMDARHVQKIERFIGQRLQLDTIEGLEPTKKPSSSAAAPSASRNKRFGKSNGDDRSRFAKKRDDRGGDERKPFAKKFEGSKDRDYSRDSRSSDDRSRFPKKRDERGGDERKPYAKKFEASRDRDFSRDSRSSDDRSRFAKKRDDRGGDERKPFAKKFEGSRDRDSSRETRSTDERRPFPKKRDDRGGDERKPFAKKFEGKRDRDSGRETRSTDDRSRFAKKREERSDDKKPYARRSESKRDARGSEVKVSYAAKSGNKKKPFAKSKSPKSRGGERTRRD